MPSRSSSSTATSEESDDGTYDSTQRPDRFVAKALEGISFFAHLMAQFKIPDGSTGYGYGQVFAGCLNENLKSVHVEDPNMDKKYQARNFAQFCYLLAEKCINLKEITLITPPGGPGDRPNNRQVKEFRELESSLEARGIHLHVEYKKGLHNGEIYFDNGWTVILGRGLNYFKRSISRPFNEMNLLACETTTIHIIRQPDDRPDGSTQRTADQLSAEALEGLSLFAHLMVQFKIPDGSPGYGYDRVFASCLDKKLQSVRVEDAYMCKEYQVDHFGQFCELLAKAKLEKCKKLKEITLITLPEDRKKNRKVKFDRVTKFKELESSLEARRIHLCVEYKEDIHDREISFNNGWTVRIDRGLDYFKLPKNPPSGDDPYMNLRSCMKTVITIIRHKK